MLQIMVAAELLLSTASSCLMIEYQIGNDARFGNHLLPFLQYSEEINQLKILNQKETERQSLFSAIFHSRIAFSKKYNRSATKKSDRPVKITIMNGVINKIIPRPVTIVIVFATLLENYPLKSTMHQCARCHFRPVKRNTRANLQNINSDILKRVALPKLCIEQ